MSRKIYFYKHFEEPHCISPHRHTTLQTLPQVTVGRGGVCHLCNNCTAASDTLVLAHLFKMKKVDNAKCCWGDMEQISHTPRIRVEICTTALLFADIYQRSMYHRWPSISTSRYRKLHHPNVHRQQNGQTCRGVIPAMAKCAAQRRLDQHTRRG